MNCWEILVRQHPESLHKHKTEEKEKKSWINYMGIYSWTCLHAHTYYYISFNVKCNIYIMYREFCVSISRYKRVGSCQMSIIYKMRKEKHDNFLRYIYIYLYVYECILLLLVFSLLAWMFQQWLPITYMIS